jgi:hypothetical protein
MSKRVQINRNATKNGRYATGKHAVGICTRSGFKVPWKELVYEPGTNYLVSEKEDDGFNSLVAHPQNFTPEKRKERIGLRWSFPDTTISVGTVVSAEQLYLPSFASVSGQFIQYANIFSTVCIGTNVSAATSVPTGTCVGGADFSIAANSQYYLVIFQGI